MGEENIILSAQQVGKSFPVGGEVFWALRHVDLTIPRGRLTILKGRSGSGKTTLLNILSALDAPTEGKVFFEGQDLGGLSDNERGKLRRTKIGYVYQSVALIPMMTAYENVEFALRLARYSGDRRQRAQECLHMVGLGSRMTHMPQEMSGGEQQRVAIARAVAAKPLVVFADEPTAELDTNTGLQVVKIFKDLCAQEQVTVMMTTHDTGLMELGDLVYEIEDGEIIGRQYH